jgi:3-oxoacyl-[acyl-carrier protein] reductase
MLPHRRQRWTHDIFTLFTLNSPFSGDFPLRFAGKVAIVTGAGGGIGEAYAQALASEGASVVIAEIDEVQGRRVAEAINAQGGTAAFVAVDVSSMDSVQAMAASAASTFGRIDYLINNAAIFGGLESHSLMEVELDYYLRFMAVTLHGVMYCTRAAVPFMKSAGGGAIVNQSSIAAYTGAGFYGAAKLGVNGLTIAFARELGAENIRVNSIAPGIIGTPALMGLVDEPYLAKMRSNMALPRLGMPEDLTGIALFLLSDEARFITGQAISVDGGRVFRV